MTEQQDDGTTIDAEFTEKKEKKEPGLLNKFAAYVNKNRAAEAKRMKQTGERSLTEELSAFGSEWGKNLTKGMANVGKEEEAKLNGKTASTKIVRDDDDFADEILFGTKKKSNKSTGAQGNDNGVVSHAYTEKEFIDKFCEFLRYVAEDDDVGMYQYRNKQYMQVDYKYLSKLLTRYLGHKVTLKERDLSFK